MYVKPVNEYAEWLLQIAFKWQKKWREARVFEADPDPSKPKFFVTAAFPYPNSPQHVGHCRTYTIADVYARFKRMQGYNVLYPMAFHYTGTPILAMAEALQAGDKELEELMVNIYGIPREDLEQLKTPLGMAKYFSSDIKQGMIETGYSIDWRREFTTVDEEFKQFIRWQYAKLMEKGLITRGTHPVGWCPSHSMPVGMHDTKNDVEPEIGEYTLILFRIGPDRYMAAATLRPETVLGVTNVWVNPDATYVEAKIDGKIYIVSREAFFKLKFQKPRVQKLREIKGKDLVGIRAENPITGRKVVVLPARFVDPSIATGVVMSVPAHAPYDYVALREIISEKYHERVGVSVEELSPIVLIRVKGYGEVPAEDIVTKMDIKYQTDKKLEEATKKLYTDEYSHGIVRDDVVRFASSSSIVREFIEREIAGKPVKYARESTKELLKSIDAFDIMYEIINSPVYCRCGTKVVVKVLEDQWFIDYGNESWKAKAREGLKKCRIVPEELRREFENVIEWLHERAVARTRGLGTELPWDKNWIIESLSDSTIYPAFYTVIHRIRENKIPAEKLTEDFWDYILLGRGSVDELSRKLDLEKRVLEEIRREYEYWYPVDSRHSGRDLVPNHLTFYIFHHTAIFSEDKWPRQIVVNGFVLLEGKKMSKSLRNIIPLRRVIRMYGPDTVRAAVLVSAEILQDADFSDTLARSIIGQFRRIFAFIDMLHSADNIEDETDRWLRTKLQKYIERVTRALDELRVREASVTVIYDMENTLSKYLELRKKPGPAMREYIEAWVKMLSPIAPHIAEEAWEKLGHKKFISLEKWPRPAVEEVESYTLLLEQYLDKIVDDIKSVMRVVKGKVEEIVIAVADEQEWSLARIIAKAIREKQTIRDTIRELVEKGISSRDAAMITQKLSELIRDYYSEFIEAILNQQVFNEEKIIEKYIDYISAKVGISSQAIRVITRSRARDIVPSDKISQIMPLRPAIYIKSRK